MVRRGKKWFARWIVGGKIYTRSTKTGDKGLAEKKLREFTAPFRLEDEKDTLNAVASRIEGVEAEIVAHRDAEAAMTLRSVWATFKSKPKGKTARGRVIMPGARTLEDYEGRWLAFCRWVNKTYPKKDKSGQEVDWELRHITRKQAEAYIAHVAETRSANTRNKTVTLLRLIFKVLAEDARLKENPFDGIDAAPAAVQRKRPLTMSELASIVKVLDGKGEMELLFALGYYTGARLGDCVQLRWDDIDLHARKLRYTPKKTAKSNKEITLTVAPGLHRLLDAVPKSRRRGLVLPELGALYKLEPSALSKRVQQVFMDAGIETDLQVEGYSRCVARVGFHSLRHAHITALLEGGVPMDLVRQQAGHSTIGMTAHYYHASDKALKAVSAALPAIGEAGKEATPVPADRSRLLPIIKGMTEASWKADRDKLLALLGAD